MTRYFMILGLLVSFVFAPSSAGAQETSGGFSEGSILVGFDNRACNASLEGSIRYNNSTSCAEFCDGSDWVCPGGSGATEFYMAWGYTALGQLGQNDTSPNSDSRQLIQSAVMRPPNSWAKIYAGGDSSCAITPAGDAYCWGSNKNGRLGDNSTTQRNAPTAVDVTAIGPVAWDMLDTSTAGGGDVEGHTCGVTTTGAGYCWGDDSQGQLGDDAALADKTVPTLISGGFSWSVLAAGLRHSCGVTTAGVAYCWGNSTWDQNGQTSSTTVPTAIDVSGISPAPNWIDIGAGYRHSCALNGNGDAYCWGDDLLSVELGDGATDSSGPTPVKVAGGHIFASISVGYLHTCGLTTSQDIYCWGEGGAGQLGNGGTIDQNAPAALDLTAIPGTKWKFLTTDHNTTCGITTTDELYCWGYDNWGQVGDNSVSDKSTPQPVWGGGKWNAVATGASHSWGARYE